MRLSATPFAFSVLCFALTISHVMAAETEAGHYRRCLADSNANPAIALNDAETWIKAGGGAPAEHCASLALVALKRYAEAGTRLDKLAGGREKLDVGFRVALF